MSKTNIKNIIEGKYSTIEVITNDDFIEIESYKQLNTLANDIASKDTHIKVMPDYHAGAGNVIGLTMDISKSSIIVPDLIGPDIGCGVLLQTFSTTEPIDLKEFDQLVRARIKTNSQLLHEDPSYIVTTEYFKYRELRCKIDNLEQAVTTTFNTLGGGNHFIELYELAPLHYAIAVHSGSRLLGALVHRYYNDKAEFFNREEYNSKRQELIATLKEQGRHKEIEQVLSQTTPESFGLIQSKYKILSGKLVEDYIHDVQVITNYARTNRASILMSILDNLPIKHKFTNFPIDKPHNYIDDKRILRKGAQSAYNQDTVLIPINMRDGMIVGQIYGDSDNSIKYWNYSMPHGAGRVYSRSQAKQELSLKEFEDTMKDVYTTSVNKNTLDEAPKAYKSLEQILEAVEEVLKDVRVYKPIYNYKGE